MAPWSTFASGRHSNSGLAFNSAGNLFEANTDSENIYLDLTSLWAPGRIFAFFVLNGPVGRAFYSAGNLFESDQGTGNIYEFVPMATGAPSLPDYIVLTDGPLTARATSLR